MLQAMPRKSGQKFLFENVFDEALVCEDEIEEEEVEPPPTTFSEEELASARSSGFVEGRQAGIAEMQESIDQRMTVLVGEMVKQVQTLGSAHLETVADIERKMLTLALAIARKVVPPVARNHAEDAVEDVIRECLPKLREEPRIVVRVHASVMGQLRKRIDAIQVKSGFPGDVILLEDDELTEIDCRVEWSDGGAERTVAEIWAGIEKSVEDHLAATARHTTETQKPDAQGEPGGQAGENEENLNG
jgi:flagellar assembly protein FliH